MAACDEASEESMLRLSTETARLEMVLSWRSSISARANRLAKRFEDSATSELMAVEGSAAERYEAFSAL